MSVLQKYGARVGSIIVLALAVISFVFLPALSKGRRSKPAVFGSWDGIEVTNTADSVFNRQVNYLAESAEQYGLEPTDPSAQQSFNFNLFYGAYRSSILQIAMRDEVRNAGFIVSTDAVNKALLPFFADANGVYSAAKFAQVSDAQKSAWRKQVTENLQMTRYIDDVFGVSQEGYGLKTSEGEAALIASIAENERAFKYVIFTDELFPKEEILKYAADHTDLFTRYDLQMVTFSTEHEAVEALEQLKRNELSFDDAVATVSTKQGTDEAGHIPSSYRYDINALFPDASHLQTVIGLLPDTMPNSVVQTQTGWAIVRALSAPVQPDFTEEAAYTVAEKYVKDHERGLIEDYLLAHAQEFTAEIKEGNITEAAKKENIAVLTSGSFSINYGNSSLLTRLPTQTDPILGSFAADADFFTAVFSLSQGQVSEPLLANGSVVVFKAESLTTADDNVLSALKSGYTDQVRNWQAYYPISLFLMSMPVPIGQQAVFDFILQNKKFDDNFFTVFTKQS